MLNSLSLYIYISTISADVLVVVHELVAVFWEGCNLSLFNHSGIDQVGMGGLSR